MVSVFFKVPFDGGRKNSLAFLLTSPPRKKIRLVELFLKKEFLSPEDFSRGSHAEAAKGEVKSTT